MYNIAYIAYKLRYLFFFLSFEFLVIKQFELRGRYKDIMVHKHERRNYNDYEFIGKLYALRRFVYRFQCFSNLQRTE